MLIVLRSRPTSIFVPVLFVLLMGSMLAASIAGFLSTPSFGSAFALLLVVGLFAFVVGMITIATIDRGRLLLFSLFEWSEVSLSRAWIGYTVETGSKGSVEYVIQADDGAKRARLATTWTRAGAERSVRRLRDAFDVIESPARDSGRRALESELADWTRSQEKAKALLRARYASSSAWFAAFVVLGIFVLAYAVVLIFLLRGD